MIPGTLATSCSERTQAQQRTGITPLVTKDQRVIWDDSWSSRAPVRLARQRLRNLHDPPRPSDKEGVQTTQYRASGDLLHSQPLLRPEMGKNFERPLSFTLPDEQTRGDHAQAGAARNKEMMPEVKAAEKNYNLMPVQT